MTNIVIKNADYSANAIGFSLPVEGGVYGNFYGTGVDLSRNLLNHTLTATVVGSPVLEAQGMICSGDSAHVAMPFAPASLATPFTIMAAYQFNDTSGSFAPVVSNFNTSGNVGVAMIAVRGTAGDGIYRTKATVGAVEAGAARAPDIDPAAATPPERSDRIAICALSYDPSLPVLQRFTLHSPVFGISSNVPSILTYDSIGNFAGMNFRVGSHRPSGSGGNNPNKIMAAFAFDRALSGAEVGVMGDFLAGYYRRRGFTV